MAREEKTGELVLPTVPDDEAAVEVSVILPAYNEEESHRRRPRRRAQGHGRRRLPLRDHGGRRRIQGSHGRGGPRARLGPPGRAPFQPRHRRRANHRHPGGARRHHRLHRRRPHLSQRPHARDAGHDRRGRRHGHRRPQRRGRHPALPAHAGQALPAPAGRVHDRLQDPRPELRPQGPTPRGHAALPAHLAHHALLGLDHHHRLPVQRLPRQVAAHRLLRPGRLLDPSTRCATPTTTSP